MWGDWVWISYVVCRIAVGGLGLFGFVFLGGAERDIGVSLWDARGWVGWGREGIGFVLHKRCVDG